MMIVLLAIHVIAAAFWFGASILLVAVVTPALAAAGPSAAQVAPLLFRRIPSTLGVAGATTILSGLWLYWIVSGGFNSGFVHSTGGMLVSIGALCGIGALVTGIITSRLRQRGRAFAIAAIVLLFCALTLMIVGSRV